MKTNLQYSVLFLAGKLCVLLLAMGLLPVPVTAQSLNGGFDPNTNATVQALVVQPDGKVLVGGNFTMVGGQTRNRLARLNADGSLDTSFAVNVIDNNVLAIAVQADGSIVIGGQFTQVGAMLRNGIARLNANGTLDTNFDPNTNDYVDTLALQPDGKLLMAGGFTTLAPNGTGAVTRNHIARVNADGTLDMQFDPNADNNVNTLALQTDGKLMIGGQFTSLAPNGAGVITRNRIARINADGTLDMSFDPNANGNVFASALQPDGKLVVGGNFTSLTPNGTAAIPRNYIARLNPDGTLDASFDAKVTSSAYGTMWALLRQSDGKLLLAGTFTSLAPNGGPNVTRNFIARLNANGTLDMTFDPNANVVIYALAEQFDGKVLLGGSFFSLAPNGGSTVTRNHVARMNTDGTLDTSIIPSANDVVYTVVQQPDGKLVMGGEFTSVSPNGGGAITRNYIARLNADGTLDTAFDPNTHGSVVAILLQPDGKLVISGAFDYLVPNGTGFTYRKYIARLNADGTLDTNFDPTADTVVSALALQPDGKLLVGGYFTSLAPNGGSVVTRNRIARLNADGTLDTLFDPNANEVVYALALQPDGKVVIGGDFTALAPNGGASVTRNHIARLNADGTLDTSFDPNVNPNNVSTLALQPDGKLLLSGAFNSIAPHNGPAVTRHEIARLNGDGSLDMSFNPSTNNIVYSFAQQPDGKLVLGGNFTNLRPNDTGPYITRNHLARLNADGTLDMSFDPNTDGIVRALAMQADGKLMVGGGFSTLAPNGGPAVTRNNIAQLSTTQAALQALRIVPYTTGGSVVTWSRAGTGPELALPPQLEFSVAGNLYSPLGTMQRVDGGWRYSGFVAPSNNNFYLRATGQVSAGVGNGSSGLIQSTRQFYLDGNDDGIFADAFE